MSQPPRRFEDPGYEVANVVDSWAIHATIPALRLGFMNLINAIKVKL
jgi:hypothetical protein